MLIHREVWKRRMYRACAKPPHPRHQAPAWEWHNARELNYLRLQIRGKGMYCFSTLKKYFRVRTRMFLGSPICFLLVSKPIHSIKSYIALNDNYCIEA